MSNEQIIGTLQQRIAQLEDQTLQLQKAIQAKSETIDNLKDRILELEDQLAQNNPNA